VYKNAVTGATTNPVMQNPDEIDEEFAQAANEILKRAAELARIAVGAHQSAIAILGGVVSFFAIPDDEETAAEEQPV